MKQGNDEWTNDKFANYDNDGDGVVDDFDVKIDYAEWQDSNLDGNAEKNEPTCYTKGTAPDMTAVFAISPSLTTPVNAKLQIKNGSTILVIKDVELSGNEKTVEGLKWGTGLPENVENSMYTLNWEISFDGGATYSDIGSTATNFFVVYDTPQGSTLTAKRMDWATKNVSFSSTELAEKQIAEAIHNKLAEDPPYDLQENWRNIGNGWELLDDNDKYGQCKEQAYLMQCAMELLGVKHTKVVLVRASTDCNNCIDSESRPCPTHEKDWLCLDYAQTPPPKDGYPPIMHTCEACCVVKSHYYAVWPKVDAGSACGVLKKLIDEKHVIAQRYSFQGNPCSIWPQMPCCKKNNCKSKTYHACPPIDPPIPYPYAEYGQ